MLEYIVWKAPFFLLIFGRCFAMMMTMPLFSMRTISRISRLALCFYMAFIIFPHVNTENYLPFINDNSSFSLEYIMILAGEVLIGIIMGFYINIIFTAFSTAGQFFAFQMGFSASEVYDSLSQVENPLMGQFFNLIAMLIFMQGHWSQMIFSRGLTASFETLNAFSFITEAGRQHIVTFMLSGLTKLFADALIIALPIMGTLLLVSVTMGIFGKAAPQMNLLSEGFPIMILLSFFIITNLMGVLSEFFVNSFNTGFILLERLFAFFNGGQ